MSDQLARKLLQTYECREKPVRVDDSRDRRALSANVYERRHYVPSINISSR